MDVYDAEDRLLIAIGRLTLQFSALDLMISDFSICWMRALDADIGLRLIMPMPFAAKTDFLCWIVRYQAAYHAAKLDQTANQLSDAVVQYAREAKELANTRNDVVHGFIAKRDGCERRRFWNFLKDRANTSAEPESIEAIVERITNVTNNLEDACHNFDNLLVTAGV
jgi:hypothetical protein